MKGKTQLHPASRSDGDGMEDTSVTKSAPRQLTSPSSSPADLPHPVKRREPKFVPYEPYKAAVTPIMPPATTRRSHRTKLAALEIPFPLMREEDRGRRNIERPSPVISVVREVPEGTAATGCIVESNGDATPHRVASLEQQLETLREQKHDVENQLRVQIQVVFVVTVYDGTDRNCLPGCCGANRKVCACWYQIEIKRKCLGLTFLWKA